MGVSQVCYATKPSYCTISESIDRAKNSRIVAMTTRKHFLEKESSPTREELGKKMKFNKANKFQALSVSSLFVCLSVCLSLSYHH